LTRLSGDATLFFRCKRQVASPEVNRVGEGGRAGKLSPEEEAVLERARDESQRITREELPRMFETGAMRKTSTAGGARATSFPDETDEDEPETDGARLGSPARRLARALEWVNHPFRGVPPAWRMGLGLCGVLLLITLLSVLLVRML
jgi:hypothetical protein